MPDVGSLVTVRIPFTDRSGSKLRPGVVVSEYLQDYLIAYLTKEVEKYQHEASSMLITNDDVSSGRLKQTSLVRTHKKSWVDRKLCNVVGRLKPETLDKLLRKSTLFDITNYYKSIHKPRQEAPFVSGSSRVNYAGRVFDENEMGNLVDSSLDFWLTAGRYAQQFERDLAAFLDVKHCSLVNSGSSANLLALMALTSPKLGHDRIRPGDEVITVAAAFPTTVAPILQAGLIPVFVDVRLPDANVNPELLEQAITSRTKAVFLAHTLGFPFDLERVYDLCQRHGLWLIENNCDALGASCYINGEWRRTGTVGHLGTSSFYTPQHITMGEGGAVYTNDIKLKRIVESLRDWGKDCWCAPGADNICGKRFSRQFGSLPLGYDHKYVYSHMGYNLKATDMQAAIGCAQLQKLESFIKQRNANFSRMLNGLKQLHQYFHLPSVAPKTKPSPFGIMLHVRDDAGFTRNDLTTYLEKHNIQTRNLFAGNLLRHPCFDALQEGVDYRISGNLHTTDTIMNNTFWMGVYPGLFPEMIDYIIDCIQSFFKNR